MACSAQPDAVFGPIGNDSSEICPCVGFTRSADDNVLKKDIELCIWQDERTSEACGILAERQDVPKSEVVEDLRDVIFIRVNYFRSKEMNWLEQWWMGLHNVEESDFRNELKDFAKKYGMRLEHAQYASDSAYNEMLAVMKAPGEQLVEAVQPYTRGFARMVIGLVCMHYPVTGLLANGLVEFGLVSIEQQMKTSGENVTGGSEKDVLDSCGRDGKIDKQSAKEDAQVTIEEDDMKKDDVAKLSGAEKKQQPALGMLFRNPKEYREKSTFTNQKKKGLWIKVFRGFRGKQ